MIILIILSSLLISCQETPSDAIVVNKQDYLANRIQNEGTENEKNLTDLESDIIKKSVDTGNNKITVSINAKINIPNINQYPIVKIKTENFTQHQVNQIVSTLFSGRTLYKPWNKSKSEIEASIIDLKGIINNPETSQDLRELSKEELKYQEYEYGKAPDKVEKLPAITSFAVVNPNESTDYADGKEYKNQGDPFEKIDIWADFGSNSHSELSVVNKDNGKNSWMMYVRDVNSNFEGYLPYEIELIKQTNSGFEYIDAEKVAIQSLRNMGIDLDISSASLVSYLKNIKEKNDIFSAEHQAYKFYFTRKANDVKVNYDTIISLGEMNNDYSKCVFYEMASITIDESGIRDFEFRAPYKVIQTIEKDAKIIDLNMAISKFENRIRHLFIAQAPVYPFNINIHTIKLGLSRIMNIDGSYLLVPTWDFMGNIQYFNDGLRSESEIDLNLNEESLSPAYCIISVNALDGSIIDKAQGH